MAAVAVVFLRPKCIAFVVPVVVADIPELGFDCFPSFMACVGFAAELVFSGSQPEVDATASKIAFCCCDGGVLVVTGAACCAGDDGDGRVAATVAHTLAWTASKSASKSSQPPSSAHSSASTAPKWCVVCGDCAGVEGAGEAGTGDGTAFGACCCCCCCCCCC